MAGVDLSLHYRQSRALLTKATEVLYGGAAGGGKSYLMRVASISWAAEIKGLQIYLFRRVSDDLHKNHMTGIGSYPDLMAQWIEDKVVKWNGAKNFWEFWNGSCIYLCHCQYEKDVNKYQGSEIGVLLIDEATHFTPYQYRFLRGRVRLGGTKLPEKYKGVFPRILLGTNPGGISHGFFKKEFVDYSAPMNINRMPKKEGGMLRQYIPAKLTDNPTLMENDPDYADRLHALGDPALVRAMLDGDWNIVAGGALDDVWDSKLVVPDFNVPNNWKVDRSFDWGSTHPFSVIWWAEANGEEVDLPDGSTFCPPPRSLVAIAEWYGAEDIYENTGLRLGPYEIASGILEREERMLSSGKVSGRIRGGPADNQIYNINDSETDNIARKMKDRGVEWIRSDKSRGSRINGLQLVRDRMRAVKEDTGQAGIYFMESCRPCISLLPILPRDTINIEDVDTKAIDHNFDNVRYRVLHAAKQYATKLNVLMPT